METGIQPDDEDPPVVFTKQRDFLDAIHTHFIAVIHPIDSGLVDELKSTQVFDSEDEDSITAERSRRSKARRCWSLLTRVPPGRFQHVCFPALTSTCPLALDGKVFRWDGQVEGCLYHLIRRVMPLRRFADMFPGASGCTSQQYRQFIEGSDFDSSLWKKVFQLCAKNKDNATFRNMMETTLKTVEVPIPDNFQSLLADGFPCTCKTSKTKKRKKKSKKSAEKERPNKKLKKFHTDPCLQIQNDSSCSSSESSPAANFLSTNESVPTPSSEVTNEESSDSDTEDEDCVFETEEQKETFLKYLEEINEAIRKTFNIKTVFQEVKGIKAELDALQQMPKGGCTEQTSMRDRGKTHRLYSKVRERQKKLQKDYKEASSTSAETETVQHNVKLQTEQKKILLCKKKFLSRQFTKAERWYRRSLEIFDQLNLDPGDQLQSEETAGDSGSTVLPSIRFSFDEVSRQIAEQEADQFIDTEQEMDSYLNDVDSDALLSDVDLGWDHWEDLDIEDVDEEIDHDYQDEEVYSTDPEFNYDDIESEFNDQDADEEILDNGEADINSSNRNDVNDDYGDADEEDDY